MLTLLEYKGVEELKKIELVPGLTHCIEMVAKREYATVLRQLLMPRKRNKELEEKAGVLRLFLESADFQQLRLESEKRLVEGKKVLFVVCLEKGVLKYEMRVT